MKTFLWCIRSARLGLMLFCSIGFSIKGVSQIEFQEIRQISGPFPEEGKAEPVDIDGDGDLDLLVMGRLGNPFVFSTYLYRNEGSGNFTFIENTPFDGSFYGEAAYGDVDSDNDIDIIIVGYKDAGVGTGNLYLNNGDGNYTIASNHPFPSVVSASVNFFNYNGDDHLDVLISGKASHGRITSIYTGDGQGNFQEVLDVGLDPMDIVTVVFGDVDGDGDEDIIAGGRRDTLTEIGTYIYFREGDKYKRSRIRLIPAFGGAAELLDFDNDGDLDYLSVGSAGTGGVNFLINDGAGNFTPKVHPILTYSLFPDLIADDFDRDGDFDVFLGSPHPTNSATSIYLNDGNGNFVKNDYPLPQSDRMGVGVGDFDGKGYMDFIFFGPWMDNLIYMNNIDLNKPPLVTDVEITGKSLIGTNIKGTYLFGDEEGDMDNSSFQWYRADNSTGSNRTIIENAVELEYIISELDKDKFLSIEIIPNDGNSDGPPIQSIWFGPVKEPESKIVLKGNSQKIPNQNTEISLDNHTDFGGIGYGNQISKTFTIGNEGDADLSVSEILISGINSNDFSLSEIFPVIIVPGFETTFTVNFRPIGLGIRTAEIKVLSDDKQNGSFTFNVLGVGLNLPPVFSNNSFVEYNENQTLPILDINASNGEDGLEDEGIQYSISGGEDSNLFSINSTGQLSFINIPDFENPKDADKDNDYLVEITADDEELIDNLSIQYITVSVTNLDEMPIANCKDNIIIYLNENGEASLNARDLDDGSSDDMQIVSMSVEPNLFHCNDLGENTVVFTVRDSGGNSSTCQTTVNISDNIKPVISPVLPIITGNDPGKCEANIIVLPPAVVENCGDLTAIGQRSDHLSMDAAFPIGNTIITWSVADAEELVQVVRVLDVEAPVFETIAPIETSNDPGSSGASINIPSPGISDCGTVKISGSRSDGLPMASMFPVGETTITWTATDGTNSALPLVQKIMVRDNEPPILEQPSNLTLTSEAGNCGKWVSISPPNVWDNCEGVIRVTGVREDHKSLEDFFPVGVTSIKWNAVDVNNNSALEVTQLITVEKRGSGEIVFAGPDGPIEIGNDIPMAARFTDENIISATWTARDGNLIIQETYSEILTKGIGTTAYTFTNLSPGVYTVHLELKHECGNVVSKIFEYVVVYDPNGGFVTGGGWIISPEGAMKDPDMETIRGVANFGFNARYNNGKNDINEVGGETNFQFKTGNLHFKSSSHQAMSLVVSGGFKATYKGTGTLNGEPGYDFMVTVIDAAESETHPIDLFRIKISKGNRVIYDNNLVQNAENADPVTTIGGGSIVIHKPKGPKSKIQVSALDEVDFSKEELDIFSAYPNPMEENAVVGFSLSISTYAVLSLYDLNGREVLALFSGKVESNRIYEIEISKGNLMEGIYIYRLMTESGKVYQKQLMVK